MIGRTIARRWAVALQCLLSGCCSLLALAGSIAPIPGYRIRHWTVADGLPGNHLTMVTQDSMGALWIGSYAGLVRFDGHEFETFYAGNSDLPGSRVSALHYDRSGTLWVTLRNGYLVSYAQHIFRTRARLANSETRLIRSIASDRDGQIWISTTSDGAQAAVWRLRDGALEPAPEVHQKLVAAPSENARPESAFTIFLSTDRNGDVWAKLSEGPYLRIRDGFLDDHAPYRLSSPKTFDTWLLDSSSDQVEIFDVEGDLRGRFPGGPPARTLHLIDSQGFLWLSRGNILERYRPDSLQAQNSMDLNAQIEWMLEDRAGHIWVTTTDGLFRLSPSPFVVIEEDSGLLPIQAYEMPDGSISVAVQSIPAGECFPVIQVQEAGAETVAGACGAALIDNQGIRWTNYGSLWMGKRPEGSPIEIRAGTQIYQEPGRDDRLWFAGSNLLQVAVDAQSRPQVIAEYNLGLESRALWDRRGRLWAGSLLGLFLIEAGEVTQWTTADGLPVDHIRAFHEDPQGTLWIGTYGGGLVRFKEGRFGNARASDGLAEDVVSSILEDDRGNFWMAGNLGIHRASRSQIEELLDGKRNRVDSVLYSSELGLPDPATNGRPALRARDGRMWFPTLSGLVLFRPESVLEAGAEGPPIVIRRLIHEGRTVYPESPMRIEPGQRRLTIEYAGIDLSSPGSVRYEYRIDDLDREWTYLGSTRQVTFPSLPPGTHTFRVRARNASGRWSAQPAEVVLQVVPSFFESRSFLLLFGISVLILVFGAVRLRTGQLRRTARMLEEQVHSRTAELVQEKARVEEQAHQLERLNEAKSRFFAEVSHEFRTPLTLILGSLEDLKEGGEAHTQLNEAGKLILERASRNSERLLRLVQQLLEMARIEGGALSLNKRKQDFGPFLRRVVDTFDSVARQYGIDFRVDFAVGALPVHFDEDRVETILINLLSNAFKFVPAGGRVRVSASVVRNDESSRCLEVSVLDSGPGIAPEDLEHIFDRFYTRSTPLARHVDGVGIGLTLARELAEAHGGTLRAESEPGVGSCFTLKLPLEPSLSQPITVSDDKDDKKEPTADPGEIPDCRTREADAPLEAGGRSSDQPKDSPQGSTEEDAPLVLVADDSEEIRSYVRSHLSSSFRIREAVDGGQALSIARAEQPDIIVSDVMMPGMDGLAFCNALRADPETDFIPVILLTARATDDSRLAGLLSGANDYVTKPFKMAELKLRIRNQISARQKFRERILAEHREPLRQAPKTDPSTSEVDFAGLMRQIIEEHLGEEKFGVDQLVRAAGVGRTMLYLQFDEILSMSPSEFIWSVRLDRASQLLRARAGNVGEVAYAVGFQSVAHFCRRFKQRFGVSPSSYRDHSEAESS